MRLALVFLLLSALSKARPAAGQESEFTLSALRRGVNRQDRVRIQIDDEASGPDTSAPCDVGDGSFTGEYWLHGKANREQQVERARRRRDGRLQLDCRKHYRESRLLGRT